MPIVEIDTCAEVLPGFLVDNTMMCTGPLNGGISACTGDTGGPLVQDSDGDGDVSLNTISFKTYRIQGLTFNLDGTDWRFSMVFLPHLHPMWSGKQLPIRLYQSFSFQ
jgi:hypothetical protein